MPGWTDDKSLFEQEVEQVRLEEGTADRLLSMQQAIEDQGALGADACRNLLNVWAGRHREHPAEPTELVAIQTLARPAPCPAWDGSDAELLDRLHGAWLARCAGCALGKPFEVFMHPHNGLSSRKRIAMYLKAVGEREYPIRAYAPPRSPAEQTTGPVCCPRSTRSRIECLETDDDIRYTLLGTRLLEEHGLGFTSWHVARAWMSSLPYMSVCTAETQAFRNLVERYDFHLGSDWARAEQDVDWRWVRTRQNPYREWVGAAIRADAYGYACPGNPTLAAELAWRDARISHTANGIYGSMLIAAMIARAFVEPDPRQIVAGGLSHIPPQSRMAKAVLPLLDTCSPDLPDDEALDLFDTLIADLDPVHAIPHAVIVSGSLLVGATDLARALGLSVMAGRDTDCNGASVGSIVGAMLGSAAVPAGLATPLHDRIETGLIGPEYVSIAGMAARSLGIVQRAR
ncbi:MAG: ADP-ribosylglycohydrolase family protein [Leptolyngbya sp. PLA3]|nr:MAG: ADP-ribosylglycohydrolase family protein [Cyanobacteria bacterium CYA]MCE7967179.1 ADP-ribosylglycohydrolase family protein [Leptolyngbya sp. PL-A3]